MNLLHVPRQNNGSLENFVADLTASTFIVAAGIVLRSFVINQRRSRCKLLGTKRTGNVAFGFVFASKMLKKSFVVDKGFLALAAFDDSVRVFLSAMLEK
jgi:hypothetical protein